MVDAAIVGCQRTSLVTQWASVSDVFRKQFLLQVYLADPSSRFEITSHFMWALPVQLLVGHLTRCRQICTLAHIKQL